MHPAILRWLRKHDHNGMLKVYTTECGIPLARQIIGKMKGMSPEKCESPFGFIWRFRAIARKGFKEDQCWGRNPRKKILFLFGIAEIIPPPRHAILATFSLWKKSQNKKSIWVGPPPLPPLLNAIWATVSLLKSLQINLGSPPGPPHRGNAQKKGCFFLGLLP